LKGNLKEVASNLNNSDKSRVEIKTNLKVFVPIKNKIKLMEKDEVKSKNESEEFKQKHKSIMTQKLIENYENEPEIESDCMSNEKNGNCQDNSNGEEFLGNLNAQNNDVPPKPLPRKSISDQGSFEENYPPMLPKPRPRTTCPNISYKVDNNFRS
jgi:hypothetical protein